MQARSGAGLEAWWRDVTFGARLLRRHPVFTITAVISLGIGIGATTTIFDAERAAAAAVAGGRAAPAGRIRSHHAVRARHRVLLSRFHERLRDESAAFSGMVALSKSTFAAAGTAGGGRAEGRLVSGNFFEVLALRPAAGRLLSSEDDRASTATRAPVAVISHRFWRREFGDSAAALGQIIRIGSVAFTVVGVGQPRSTT